VGKLGHTGTEGENGAEWQVWVLQTTISDQQWDRTPGVGMLAHPIQRARRRGHPLHTDLGSGVREHRRTLPTIHPTNRLRGTPRETVLPGGPFYFLDGPVALVYSTLQPNLFK
jgi:hypothetical protein